MLLNDDVDIITLGHTDYGALEILSIEREPLGHLAVCTLLTDRLEALHIAAVAANGNDLTGLYNVGGDVDLLAVNGDVTVYNELTGLRAACAEGKAVTTLSSLRSQRARRLSPVTPRILVAIS